MVWVTWEAGTQAALHKVIGRSHEVSAIERKKEKKTAHVYIERK